MNVDEIRAALDGMSLETLADALAIVLAEGKPPSLAVAGADRPELSNFAQAIAYLKKNYGFEELEYFTTESDLVYVNAGDRRVLLTERMNAPPAKNKNVCEMKNFENNDGQSGSGGRFSNLEI
jgi:hypothetical protein